MNDESCHWAALERTGFFGEEAAGCIVLARSTGRILLAHRSDNPPPFDVQEPGTWGCWSGALEEGETPLACALREIHEEAGYQGDVVEIHPLYVFANPEKTFRFKNFLFVVGREFEPTLNWKNQGYRWCEFGHWPAPLHFGLEALFADPASVQIIRQVLRTDT